MDISGTNILFDADNMNIEEGIEIETAYSLLSTFMDKYDYMYDMSECTNAQAYCLVANAKDIYHLIRATWNILENVKEQELIGNAFDVVKVIQDAADGKGAVRA